MIVSILLVLKNISSLLSLLLPTLKEYLHYPAGIYQLKVKKCQLWTYFTPCSSFSIVNFEHVIASWLNVKNKYINK